MSDKPFDEEAIFKVACQIPSAEARTAYLNHVCGDNPAVLERISALLRVFDEESHFLCSPPPGIEATELTAVTELPGDTIGPYNLLQQIGEGGMGVVYMAEQTHPVERRVALKIIKPGMDTRQVIARFEAERQALAMMDHPNIAKVLDAGTTDSGRPYFVMELVKGMPVTQYCDEQHLSPRERLELFVPICQAVQHAHQKGIIHRDLKPSNILIAQYDDKPVPKIIDFGVAKAVSHNLTEKTMFTQYGQIVGTIEYMSPEQARFNQLDVDTRSDVYSLGVLLYELLTGETPFDKKRLRAAAFDELLRIIRDEEPPKMSIRLSSSETLANTAINRKTEPKKLNLLVRGELDWIVMKALEKDRNRRYETANGFAADVQRYLSDETVQACPPSASYRFRKFARRNKRTLAAVVVVGVALLVSVGAVAGSIGWMAHERTVRQTALEQEVNLALNEAERWQNQGKWPEALSAARRAEGLLAGSDSAALRERVKQLHQDLEMVLRLEEIPFLRSEMKENRWDYEAADQAYAKAFADYGIDILDLPVEEATVRIRARPKLTAALVNAIDEWAHVRMNIDQASGLALRGVAEAAEPDPWRLQVREAYARKDTQALAALAASPDLSRQPPTSLRTLAGSLHAVGLELARVEVLRRAQWLYPGDFWINMNLANALDSMGATFQDEVVAFCRSAVAIRPQCAAAHSNLGSTLLDQGKLDEAADAFRKAIALDPKYADAYTNLGSNLHKQQKLPEAIVAHRQAIKLDPRNATAYSNLALSLVKLYDPKKLPEATAAAEKAIELDPKYANAYNVQGMILSEQTKLPEAIAAYQTAIDLDPKHANAYSNLGNSFARQGNFDQAIECCRKALEIDPMCTGAYSAYNALGIALRQQGKLDEAVAACRKAIELDPNNAAAYNNLGVTLRAHNKADEAITAYRKAIEIDPKNAGVYRNLGRVLAGTGKFDDAIVCYRRAIELDPSENWAHSNLAAALQDQGRWAEAIATLEAHVRLQPDFAHTYNNLAWAMATCPDARLRDPPRALEFAKKRQQLAAPDAISWNTLGVASYRAGDYEAAVAALTQSIREGGDGVSWFFLTMAYWQLDEKSEARQWYDKAVAWMETNDKANQDLLRFREEAEQLILKNSEVRDQQPVRAEKPKDH